MNETPGNTWEPEATDVDDTAFDVFARNAGASLRSTAPKDGFGAVVRQGNRERTRRLALQVGVVGALVVAGIVVFTRTHLNSTSVNNQQSTTSTTPSTEPSPTASAAEIQQWFLDYTGNPTGAATGAPVKFGVAMNAFPYQYQLGLAVDYLNDHAGGVGGQPIALDVCKEDVSVCADRFAADPSVVAVLENQWQGDKYTNAFSEPIGTALAGRKPLHTTYTDAGTSGVEYYPSYFETLWAMMLQAEKVTAPGSRVLVISATDQDRLAADSAQLTSGLADRQVALVHASEAGALAQQIRDAGATDASAVVLAAPAFVISQTPLADASLVCDNLAAALDELDMHAPVIVDACDPHEGWYKLDAGFNETSPEDSGAAQIITAMPHLGPTLSGPANRDVREAGALLAVVRMINELGGPSQATPAALDKAMREFTGPMPLAAGDLDCSSTGKLAERRQPGSCVRFIDVHQFVGDHWIDLQPIDLAA